MNLTEKQLSAEYRFKGRVINLRVDSVMLPNGKTSSREVVEHPGGVCVAALTEDDEIVFVRQYRYPYFEETLEIPAGKRDKEGDSDPLACGIRELKEETGITAEKYFPLGILYPTPGYCNEIIHIFGACELSYGDAAPDDGEFLNVVKMPLQKAAQMVMSGEIPDAKTQIAVLKLKLMRENGEI